MIGALILVSLVAWCSWGLFRLVRSTRATTVSTPNRVTIGEKGCRGLEDDPAQWASAHGAWTVLDELQLTRLLKESSTATGPDSKSIDTNASHLDREDKP